MRRVYMHDLEGIFNRSAILGSGAMADYFFQEKCQTTARISYVRAVSEALFKDQERGHVPFPPQEPQSAMARAGNRQESSFSASVAEILSNTRRRFQIR